MRPFEEEPQFYYVNNILQPVDNVIFILNRIDNADFDEHFQSYEIEFSKIIWSIFFLSDLKSCSFSKIVTGINGKKYIPKRWV